MYFSIIATALRIFSRVKLLDVFKTNHNEQSAEKLTDLLAENTEKLILACVLYRFIFNMAMLLALLLYVVDLVATPSAKPGGERPLGGSEFDPGAESAFVADGRRQVRRCGAGIRVGIL